MGDRLRVRKRRNEYVQGMAAAAKILAANRRDAPQAMPWHEEAWGFRETVGEIRAVETWLGNSMSRARLIAARRAEPGAEPEPLDADHPASQAMAELAGGVGGQAALLRQFAIHLLTPGIGYLVGEGVPGTDRNRYQVVSAEQIRLSATARDEVTGEPLYELQTGPNAEDFRPITGLVTAVRRPDPRRSWLPDSPVRGALPILRELVLLTQHVEATATSRLAGPGIVWMDGSLNFEEGWEAWIRDFVKATNAPIKNRNAAGAYTPFPVRVPVPANKKLPDVLMHTVFATPFDEHAMELRAEAIQRLATAMDLPTRTLTGEQTNHWGEASTQDQGVKIHVVPGLELVCDGLTHGYLLPRLVSSGATDQPAPDGDGRLLQVVREPQELVDEDDGEVIAWYDLSDFSKKLDNSDDAREAWDRMAASDATLRDALGLGEGDAPDPAEMERRTWQAIVQGGGDAQLVALALLKLGYIKPDEMPARPQVAVPAGGPPAPGLPAGGPEDEGPVDERGEPEPRTEPDDDPPSGRPVVVPAAAAMQLGSGQALAEACDGLVQRALEKAGNRLRSRGQGRRDVAMHLAPELMHTGCTAFAVLPQETLLEGAWARVPVVASRCGVPPERLQQVLEAYVVQVIRHRVPHTFERLVDHLADVWAAPASRSA